MKKIYTDKIDSAKSLNLEFEFLVIDDYDSNVNSLFLIFDNKFKIESILDKGYIVTLFHSDFSDFEILDTEKIIIRDKLNLFFDLIKKSRIENISNEELTRVENKLLLSAKEEVELDDSVLIEEYSSFKGIYVNDILIKKGNIRFIPVYEVILHIFKEKFSGKLVITKKNTEIYIINFYNGEITNIESFKETDNFQYFLKKYGYISSINKDIYLYPIKKQLDLYIASNSVFKHEKNIILKDFFSFLFRNIISLNSGDFEINNNCDNNSRVFSDYLNFLYNFINYLKNKLKLPEYLSISNDIILNENQFNEEMINILNEVKNGKSITEIQAFFTKYDKNYIINALYFFKILGIIKENKSSDDFIVSSTSVDENISRRIRIWMDKIKKENYFNLLGININDNEQYIEEKFRNLFSQFSTYLSSEELRIKYRNDLDDIIFELESAYNVVKNKKLRNEYYKKMLK